MRTKYIKYIIEGFENVLLCNQKEIKDFEKDIEKVFDLKISLGDLVDGEIRDDLAAFIFDQGLAPLEFCVSPKNNIITISFRDFFKKESFNKLLEP